MPGGLLLSQFLSLSFPAQRVLPREFLTFGVQPRNFLPYLFFPQGFLAYDLLSRGLGSFLFQSRGILAGLLLLLLLRLATKRFLPDEFLVLGFQARRCELGRLFGTEGILPLLFLPQGFLLSLQRILPDLERRILCLAEDSQRRGLDRE